MLGTRQIEELLHEKSYMLQNRPSLMKKASIDDFDP